MASYDSFKIPTSYNQRSLAKKISESQAEMLENRTRAETARAETEALKNETDAIKSETEAIKTAAEAVKQSAINETAELKDAAETAKDAAEAAESGAERSAENAERSESGALDAAELAKSYAAGEGADTATQTIDEAHPNQAADNARAYAAAAARSAADLTAAFESASAALREAYESALAGIAAKVPPQASAENQLADKNFVNSSIQTNTAYYRGEYGAWADVPMSAESYPVDSNGNREPTNNDYLTVTDASGYGDGSRTGTWRFKYTGAWAVNGKDGWRPEYQVNGTPLTAAQLAALNSGATAAIVNGVKTIDTALSTTSTHVVQNKAVTAGINAKYTKPAGGIPKADLASAVQTSLGKADTALQSHQSLDNKNDKITVSNNTTAIADTDTFVTTATDSNPTSWTRKTFAMIKTWIQKIIATASAYGLVKVAAVDSAAKTTNDGDTGRLCGVRRDSNGKLYVGIPEYTNVGVPVTVGNGGFGRAMDAVVKFATVYKNSERGFPFYVTAQGVTSNGFYVKFSNGLIVQWKKATPVSQSSWTTITFPTPFTNAEYVIVITPNSEGSSAGAYTIHKKDRTKYGLSVRQSSGGWSNTYGYEYIAIGC